MNILVMIKEQHTIDAKGKKLGRVASEAAHILMGKNTPDFTRNNVKDVVVSITNATEIEFEDYFPILELRKLLLHPLTVNPESVNFSAEIHVKGGGISAQAEAIRLGIARAL